MVTTISASSSESPSSDSRRHYRRSGDIDKLASQSVPIPIPGSNSSTTGEGSSGMGESTVFGLKAKWRKSLGRKGSLLNFFQYLKIM